MEVRACVVRAPNWVGDAVMSLGGLRELRRIIGGARLAVAARPWVAAIYEETGIVDEVIPLDRRSWRDSFAHAGAIRVGGYDLAVLFQNAFEAAFVARLARVPRIAGFATERRGLLLTDEVPLHANHATEHQSRYYMRIVAGVERALDGSDSVDPARPDCSLAPRPETVAAGRLRLEAEGIASTETVVSVNPGATNSRAKQWLPERFAAAADRIAESTGARIAILGSASESGTAASVMAALERPERAINLTGKTSLRELIGVLASSLALVSNDTGPAHLAAALGLPTVTVFGPTEAFATRPLGKRAVVVDHPVDCSPCMLRDCPIDHRCMTGVTVDSVVTAARGVIGAVRDGERTT